jgi:hypothetical protein
LLRRRVAMVVSARMEGGWPMTLSTAVLRPGDWVHYDGSEHQVLALAGTSVRLRTVDGAESVVLAGHLFAHQRPLFADFVMPTCREQELAQ